MSGPALDVVDLAKRYGQFAAVHGVTFSVPMGSVVGLLGPNGSGKSSVLHSLTGVVSPTSGRVLLCGHPHDSAAAKALLGFVPDDLALPMSLTGHEYLDLVRRLQPAADMTLGAELVELLNLGHALGRLVAEYSHGMKRKIQVIAALMHRPGLLVLDEPFRGLDPEAHLILRRIISSFVGDGGGVLVATHDLSAAQGYCDSVVVVSDGRVVAQGPPPDLIREWRQESLVGVFLAATGLQARTHEVQARLSRLLLTDRGRRDHDLAASRQRGD